MPAILKLINLTCAVWIRARFCSSQGSLWLQPRVVGGTSVVLNPSTHAIACCVRVAPHSCAGQRLHMLAGNLFRCMCVLAPLNMVLTATACMCMPAILYATSRHKSILAYLACCVARAHCGLVSRAKEDPAECPCSPCTRQSIHGPMGCLAEDEE